MAEKKRCLSCGNQFIGRKNALHCSPACRVRAHRSRRAESVTDETVTRSRPKRPRSSRPPATRRSESRSKGVTSTDTPTRSGHSPQALALLAALAEEASDAAEDRGEEPWAEGEDDWSAAERAVLDMVAAAVDRRVDLEARYAASDDDKSRIELSKELRLIQGQIAQLLKQIKTDLPPEPSRTSQKASQAASTRWRNHG